MNWREVRAYCYDVQQREGLLVDAVWPAVRKERADGVVAGGYFQRGWEGGQHLAVLLGGTDGDAVSRVVESAEEYLAPRPISSPASDARRGDIQEALGRWELRSRDEPEVDDHSVLVIDDPGREAFWGGSGLQEEGRAFFAETSDWVADLIREHRGDRNARRIVALKLMIVLAWLGDPELVSSHITYRSHVEGFLGGVRSGDRLKRQFESRYRAQAEGTARLVDDVVEDLGDGDEDAVVPGLGGYVDALLVTWERVRDEIERGEANPPDGDEFVALAADELDVVPQWEDVASSSEFHEALAGEGWRRFMAENTDFLSFRVMVNLLYGTLQQLGVRPLERYLLCWTLARTVEESRGVDVLGRVREAERLLRSGEAGGRGPRLSRHR